MRIKDIRTNCWIKFLESRDCKYARTKASHEHWKCPGCFRTVTFYGHLKAVPGFQIEGDLKTMGVSREEFLEWVDKNC